MAGPLSHCFRRLCNATLSINPPPFRFNIYLLSSYTAPTSSLAAVLPTRSLHSQSISVYISSSLPKPMSLVEENGSGNRNGEFGINELGTLVNFFLVSESLGYSITCVIEQDTPLCVSVNTYICVSLCAPGVIEKHAGHCI